MSSWTLRILQENDEKDKEIAVKNEELSSKSEALDKYVRELESARHERDREHNMRLDAERELRECKLPEKVVDTNTAALESIGDAKRRNEIDKFRKICASYETTMAGPALARPPLWATGDHGVSLLAPVAPG